MKLLALDQASNITGWAIFENSKLVSYGMIDASNQNDIGKRLYKIRQSVEKLILDNNIDKVIL